MAIWTLDGVAPEFPADRSHWVAPSADLIGRVRLGREASVWFGAVLRGDNEWIEIGDRTNVQDQSVLHTDIGAPLTVGADCTIGHRVTLHGCTVGRGTLVGMGAVILNHARIGEGCLVGAGALITEGKEFPDHSLIVGAPARVMRPLDEEAVARLLGSAERYAANARRFAAGLSLL
jgi:carbonic anhydrase/acetyltransferase-like protein (isoleucine patch superfamily)